MFREFMGEIRARWRSVDQSSLTFQLVMALLILACGTILLIGLPTAWLARRELENQDWARLDQAVRVSRSLYDYQRREVAALALLTAQRPTLKDHILHGNTQALDTYLDTLRTTAELDAVVILDTTGRVLGTAAEGNPVGRSAAEALGHQDLKFQPPGNARPEGATLVDPSSTPAGGQSAVIMAGNGTALLIAAEAPILGTSGAQPLGTARVAVLLDRLFVAQLQAETGLEHSLLVGSQCIATSLVNSTCPAPLSAGEGGGRRVIQAGGQTYYIAWLPLLPIEAGVAGGDEVALPATESIATADRIYGILLVSSMLFAALVGLLGYVLAHRLTTPLLRLAAASEAMGRGHLDRPLPPIPGPAEVSVLNQTLEQMRRRLKLAYDALHRAKTRSENLIAALSEGVVTVDDAGRITSFSPSAERIMGWHHSEVIGRAYDTVFRPAEDQLSEARRPPGALQREQVLTRNGQPIVLSIAGGALMPQDGGVWEQAHVFRDVTAEEEALRIRESFLASVSHEFKTPLTALRAAIELLVTRQGTLGDKERRQLLDSALLGTWRLEELVDNLLSSSSIQAGQFEIRPRPVDLESLAEEVLLTAQPLLRLRGQHLELHLPPDLPPVQADPRRLMQVLVNLISNASKYGPPNRPIRLQAELGLGMITVRVIDEGPGIPADRRAQLFQPFKYYSPEDGRLARSAGVGLGLSIVKTIVERHHGQVGVNSHDAGTAFWFTLPVAEVSSSR